MSPQAARRPLERLVLSVEVRLVLPSEGRVVGPVSLPELPDVGTLLDHQGKRYRVSMLMRSFHGPLVHLEEA